MGRLPIDCVASVTHNDVFLVTVVTVQEHGYIEGVSSSYSVLLLVNYNLSNSVNQLILNMVYLVHLNLLQCVLLLLVIVHSNSTSLWIANDSIWWFFQLNLLGIYFQVYS